MSKDTGGPAFPFPPLYGSDGCGIMEGSNGMTLRDWFAGQAMTGLLLSMPQPSGLEEGTRYSELVRKSFLAADAMIAERNKP